MKRVQRSLEVQRVAFQRVYDDILMTIQSTDPDFDDIQGNLLLLDKIIETINELDKQMLDFLLDTDCAEEIIDLQFKKADELTSKYNKLKFMVEGKLNRKTPSESISQSGHSHLKLPRIEFKRFGGDISDWLTFWGQFKRIHEDESLKLEDKFQYLVQSTIPKSRARIIVESYPPSGQNYIKALESLKTRFGKDELLVEFYVRELLKLVLTNLRVKPSLSTLFDKLQSQLRALETLGVTSQKYAAMLFPLVESCLPEGILRTWQRSTDEFGESKERLESLMKFLRREVENEERISLALSGFELNSKKKEDNTKSIPTASGLLNHKPVRCVFCKNSHSSKDCDKAPKMKLAERKKVLSTKGCCHICLKFGHIARRCKVKIECLRCRRRHSTMMCPEDEVLELPNVEIPETGSQSQSIVENLCNHRSFFTNTACCT